MIKSESHTHKIYNLYAYKIKYNPSKIKLLHLTYILPLQTAVEHKPIEQKHYRQEDEEFKRIKKHNFYKNGCKDNTFRPNHHHSPISSNTWKHCLCSHRVTIGANAIVLVGSASECGMTSAFLRYDMNGRRFDPCYWIPHFYGMTLKQTL